MKVIDFEYISKLHIPPQTIYNWHNDVWKIKNDCILPPKMKMWQGESGRYITMPCVIPAMDTAGVKFISRNVDDYEGIPARNSNIMLQKCSRSGLVAVMDGTWITNMRTGATAAHSVIEYSKSNFQSLGIMGLGMAARSFMHILGNVFHQELLIRLLRYKNQAELFTEQFTKDFPQFHFEIVERYEDICACDAVVSAVSFARTVFADDSIFQPGCVVVPIHTAGFQNCDLTFDKVIIDDDDHVSGYQYYKEFKDKAIEITEIENGWRPGRENDTERIIVYSGGIALHDIYIAAKILEIAEQRNDIKDISMQQPQMRFWL